MIDYEKAEALIGTEKYPEAIALLAAEPVSILDDGNFERMERCLSSLPEQMLQQSPEGCFLALSADLRLGRANSARQWFNQLAVLRDQCPEGSPARAAVVRYVCLAGIMLPQTDNAQILLLLSILHNETISHRLPPVHLSATGRRPSVLRGAKDLSDWGRNYRAVANIVTPLEDSVLPDGGAGAVSAAVAELLYERGSLDAASIEVAGALSSPNVEIAFAGYAQLARIARLDGVSNGRPEEVLQKLGVLLEERGAAHLLPNYRALCIRFDIHRGQLDAVEEWAAASQVDALKDCCLSNAYELMSRAKALIALGRCREAVTLLESLMLVFRSDIRPLDTIECLVDSAIACELLGSRNLALDKLEEALLLAAPFRYVRVIADGGQVASRLLGQLVKENRRTGSLPASYLQSVLETAKNYALLFPLLYDQDRAAPKASAGYMPDVTPTELQVLQMLAAGKSNNQIREQLGVKLQTVKFHVSNLLEKLGAKNRIEAVNIAKELKIL